MREIIFLASMLGIGAALAVGPIFVTIIQEAATRGFAASLRVILGSAVADLVVLIPALGFGWLIARIAEATVLVSLIGAAFFLYLGWEAARDARRMWIGKAGFITPSGWAFWKGVVGNLANPLTWSFWLLSGTPTMLRAYHIAGGTGLVVFTAIWFAVASGLEAIIALIVVRTGHLVGPRGQALFNGLAAAMFWLLATSLLLQAL